MDLPKDLIDRGFKLIVQSDGRLFAVSPTRGCSLPSRDLTQVIRSARAIAAWIERREANNAR